MTHAQAILDAVWQKPGWGEFRCLKKGSSLRPLFLPSPTQAKFFDPALEWCRRKNEAGWNLYYGVNVRDETRGTNDSVSHYNAFVADLDEPEKSWPGVCELASHGLEASIGIRTARGLHLYWLLQQPEPVNPDTQNQMRYLQKALGSDAVHDPARVLRMPGSIAWSKGSGFKVYPAWFNPGLRYTTDDISRVVHEVYPALKDTYVNHVLPAPPLPHLSMCGTDLVSLFTIDPGKGYRSEKCIAFMQAALFRGWDPNRIAETVMQLPIGQHYIDRGRSGPSSLMYDLQRAMGRVQEMEEFTFNAEVVAAGCIEEPNDVGVNELKLRVRLRLSVGMHLDEWLTIERVSTPTSPRWNAFCSALNWAPDHSNILFSANGLVGRQLRVALRQTTRLRVGYFLPA